MARTSGPWPRLSLVLLVLAPSIAGATEIHGRINLVGRGGRSADPRECLIYFTARAAVEVKPPAVPFDVVTRKKEFMPRVLAVPQGSTVRFPNQDRILHNVFSVSAKNGFDLGTYRAGHSRQVTFREPGLVRVFCNVHHSMASYVLVLDTPFHTTTDRSGAFRLSGLPAGGGTLTVWHERARKFTRQIEPAFTGPINVSLEVTKLRLPPHLNKFGKPYSRDGRGRYQ